MRDVETPVSVYIGPNVLDFTVIEIVLPDHEVEAFILATEQYERTALKHHALGAWVSTYIAMDHALDQFLPPYPPQTGVQNE